MPLLDHFRPPMSTERRWESFHSSWVTRIADDLTEHWLPPNFIAEENVHIGPMFEIDVGTFERDRTVTAEESDAAVALRNPRVWTPPAPEAVLPSVIPDTFEVRVLCTETGPKLVAVIELISPGNKDRDAQRRAFATKCASYLYQEVSLIIVDIVTTRRANLHNDILRVMEMDGTLNLATEIQLYAVAYRPLRRDGKEVIDVWRTSLTLGGPLPELPLGLGGDLVVPVNLETTYAEACRRKRLTGS
jgi:uncharacterized protein DUF4058